MVVKYETSVIAPSDGVSKNKDYYHVNDEIYSLSIGSVLLALQSDAEFYKNPTKEQLRKSINKIIIEHLAVCRDDAAFYAREVLPKFIKGVGA